MAKQKFGYAGGELELFAKAANWKRYWSRFIQTYIGSKVLEVGAGIGENTALLCGAAQMEWTCLEPDARHVDVISEKKRCGRVPKHCEVFHGTLADLPSGRTFDTILYIDVLEHIQDDRNEVRLAARCLTPGGHLIVLAPAHNYLYSPFDARIGHYRRYNRKMLRQLTPEDTAVERILYLDSVGLLASMANRALLRQSMPKISQIALWDKGMVPVSYIVDRVMFYRLGKSILAVWKRTPALGARTFSSTCDTQDRKRADEDVRAPRVCL